MAKKYDYSKSLWKGAREALVWIIPQIVVVVSTASWGKVTIAAAVSYAASWTLDYLRHKN